MIERRWTARHDRDPLRHPYERTYRPARCAAPNGLHCWATLGRMSLMHEHSVSRPRAVAWVAILVVALIGSGCAPSSSFPTGGPSTALSAAPSTAQSATPSAIPSATPGPTDGPAVT